jgi:hypothetical protein
MKPRYSKRTVDEAVQLLDVYASQTGGTLVGAIDHLRSGTAATVLACSAWTQTNVSGFTLHEEAAEAAQRLREGWRP